MLQCASTLCAISAPPRPPPAAPRPPFAAGVPVCVASISTLSGNAATCSMYERVASIAPRMAAISGTFVVNSRVTSITGALSGPYDSMGNIMMIGAKFDDSTDRYTERLLSAVMLNDGQRRTMRSPHAVPAERALHELVAAVVAESAAAAAAGAALRFRRRGAVVPAHDEHVLAELVRRDLEVELVAHAVRDEQAAVGLGRGRNHAAVRLRGGGRLGAAPAAGATGGAGGRDHRGCGGGAGAGVGGRPRASGNRRIPPDTPPRGGKRCEWT